MTLTYTPRLKLAVPDFLTEPWHAEFAEAMESIDRMVYNALLMQGAALWLNSTAYVVGDIVISPDNGVLYTCAAPHTSSASPQTFTAELAAHPTYWTTTGPALATQAEAEAGVDNTKFMSPLRTKQAIAAQVSQSSQFTPRAGQLTYVSGSQLAFKPYNGNKIKINGVLYDIPSAGIPGLGKSGVNVNGVPGQNLAANTTYWVYAQVIGGIVTGVYTTNAYRASQTAGNEGVMVQFDGVNEFPQDTLIGLVRMDNPAGFVSDGIVGWVRSWFNDPGISLKDSLSGTTGVTNTVYTEISTALRTFWVNWANEIVHHDFAGTFSIPGGTVQTIHLSMAIDGTIQEVYTQRDSAADTRSESMSLSMNSRPAEGNHFLSIMARTTSGVTVNCEVDANATGQRPTAHTFIPPRG